MSIWQSPGVSVVVEETGTTAAGADRYFPSSVGFEIRDLVVFDIQIKATAGTFTVEATLDNGTATVENWVDISQAFEDLNTGLKSSSITALDTILQCNGLSVEKLRLKFTEPGSGTYDLQVIRRTK